MRLAFPGVFGTHPPLGTAPSTARWLWVIWHAGFPGLLGLATAPWPAGWRRSCPAAARRRTVGTTTAVAVLAALAPVLYTGLLGSQLPVVIHGNDASRMAQLGGPPMLFCVVGGTLLAIRGLRHSTGPEKWAVVACVAVLGDVLLILTSHSRYSLGWYAGRLLTVTAAGVVFLAMLAEIKQIKRAAERDRSQAVLARRREAEAASAAKSAFLATMSHEIRTPMNAVIGMTGLLMDTELTADQREFVETVRSSGDALLAIINDVLDFSKIESGGLELEQAPFDLRDCVEATVDMLAGAATAKGLDLIVDVDPSCPSALVGDPDRLRQILVNLLSNAIKFTERGEILVKVRTRPEADDHVLLVIDVADTGIGIPADRTDRLFRSFSQVDASTTRVYGGTGLGLAISRRLAEAMDGGLTVSSVAGRGSVFTLTARLRVGEAAPSGAAPLPDLRGRAVLVVDDNATNRRILRLQLESWGMVPRVTAYPAEGLAWVRAGERLDLGVLELAMPDMDGVELAAAIRGCDAGRELPTGP